MEMIVVPSGPRYRDYATGRIQLSLCMGYGWHIDSDLLIFMTEWLETSPNDVVQSTLLAAVHWIEDSMNQKRIAAGKPITPTNHVTLTVEACPEHQVYHNRYPLDYGLAVGQILRSTKQRQIHGLLTVFEERTKHLDRSRPDLFHPYWQQTLAEGNEIYVSARILCEAMRHRAPWLGYHLTPPPDPDE